MDERRHNDAEADRARARMRGFALHMSGYFVVVAALFLVNRYATGGAPWFVLPMVGWGSVLALHAAWAMGLFDTLLGR